jgi:hypothetical protein
MDLEHVGDALESRREPLCWRTRWRRYLLSLPRSGVGLRGDE